MTYRVVFIETEEGIAVFCPAMPGCASQGEAEADALENIREAMALWLDAGGIVEANDGALREAELRREAAADSLRVIVRDVDLPIAVR